MASYQLSFISKTSSSTVRTSINSVASTTTSPANYMATSQLSGQTSISAVTGATVPPSPSTAWQLSTVWADIFQRCGRCYHLPCLLHGSLSTVPDEVRTNLVRTNLVRTNSKKVRTNSKCGRTRCLPTEVQKLRGM